MRFLHFPPVLNLQLKRFEYDMMTGNMIKINDKFEFPERLDVNPFLVEQQDQPNYYVLHSVLVHSGGVHGGHYYVYIRPQVSFVEPCETALAESQTKTKKSAVKSKYFKFDDETVKKVKDRDAMEFGGDFNFHTVNCSSAYMLVYVKETKLNEIMLPVTDQDIPSHLSERFSKETEEKVAREQERVRERLMDTISIFTAEDVAQFDHYKSKTNSDFAHHPLHRVKVSRTACFHELLLQVCRYIALLCFSVVYL